MFVVKTREEIQPFCYEHLTEMMPYDEAAVAYVCPVWDCLVGYASSGYFIAAKEGDRVEQSTRPSIWCPNDEMPMYLAEIHPEHKAIGFGNVLSAARASRIWSSSKVGNDPSKLAANQPHE